MAYLSISLLGPVEITLDKQRVPKLEGSRQMQGLLAYLAVEANTPHSRETLASLFWPEKLEDSARGSLRTALNRLRHVLGDLDASTPFLLPTRHAIQFNLASDHWFIPMSTLGGLRATWAICSTTSARNFLGPSRT